MVTKLTCYTSQTETSLAEIKSQVKMVLRKMNRNSADQATLDSGPYTMQYVVKIQYPFGPVGSVVLAGKCNKA